MEGFYLLCGHLFGDYIFQNDAQARWKSGVPVDARRDIRPEFHRWLDLFSLFVCTAHCALYTLAIWVFTVSWITWPGLLVCFLAHWFIDRFRLARRWMMAIGQKEFATGMYAPWSIVVVDNIMHLLTLAVIAQSYGRT